MDFEFGVLGPLSVTAAALPVAVPGERQRVLLATLLLRANHTVGISQLVNAVWGEDPPLTARRQVQNGVSLLRRALDDGGGADLIRSEPDGYHLIVPADRLDLARFERCQTEGRRLAAAGEPAAAARALRLALSCWRGPALGELANGPLQRDAERLDEQRLAVLEECAELELACGAEAGLVDELAAALAEHPLRERLAAVLMLALYRVGRQAEALAVYRRTAETLAEQLGIDPGAELRQRHEAILRNDPALARTASGDEDSPRRPELEPPAQLPTAVRQFTGRASQLATLDGLLARSPGPGESLIVTVTGSAGVGKTALSVQWAHRVRERFPDGQLYVDLRGRTRHDALRSLDALHQCMRSLGAAPEQIPLDLEAAAAAYRSLLAERRVLIILDNAADSAQVRPLLPGNTTCLTLITSRNRLGGLVAVNGAEEIRLDVLPPDEAITLLGGLVGEDRVAAEPQAAADLAQLCAGLPLALRISAANLTGRPFGTLAEHASRLRTGNLLAHLTIPGDDGSSVRGAFHLSYHDLSEPARLMFRGLGLLDGADVTAPAAAALTDTTVATARSTLDELAAAHLIHLHAPERYTLHDLLRLYAAECSSADDPRDRAAARRRLAEHYLSVADSATRLLYPYILRLPADPPGAVSPFDSQEAALAWLEAELANLVATVVHAPEHGFAGLAVRLGDVLRGFLSHRMYTADWMAVATASVAAARADGDLRGEAAALVSLGTLEWLRGRAAAAVDHYRGALAQATAAGWTEGRAVIVGNLGSAYGELGQLATAADMLIEARALNRRLGRRTGEATNLANLSYLQISLGRLAEAADNARSAIGMHAGPNRSAAANTMSNLGYVLRLQGHLRQAENELEAALDLHRAMGNRGSEADALVTLAAVQRDAGRGEEAEQTASAALELAIQTGRQRFQADAMLVLGSLEERRGRPAAALRCFEQASALARSTGYPEGLGQSLIGLAGCELRLGAVDRAEAHVDEALDLAARGYRLLLGDALTRRAEVHRDAGRLSAARADAEAALTVHRETGYRLGELRARALLGSIVRHLEPAAIAVATAAAPAVATATATATTALTGIAGQPPRGTGQV